MNGRDKRRKKYRLRKAAAKAVQHARDPWGGTCPNGCGGRGPHFVPPSLGERGFYVCTKKF